MTAQELEEALQQTVDFGQRQRLMKQLWRLEHADSSPKSDGAAQAKSVARSGLNTSRPEPSAASVSS